MQCSKVLMHSLLHMGHLHVMKQLFCNLVIGVSGNERVKGPWP